VHERFPPLQWLRHPLRSLWLRLFRMTLATEEGRTAARRAVLDPEPRGGLGLVGARDLAPAYPDLASAPAEPLTCDRSDIVFITARFRSGSTLLWNLFRNLPSCTSYYEPFNERRWFDPSARGGHTDPTHRQVSDYWKEYEGLTELSALYRKEWHERDLYLPAGAWQPDMKRFIEILVEKAPRRPVLQFNRIDLRLPWIRHEFPNAEVLHLYRHPRDQWCSSLLDPKKLRKDDGMAEFAAHDHFYLRLWARDLRHRFPFLDERQAKHPYRLFYYLWKLSYLFGRRWATRSVSFEALVANPRESLGPLLDALGIPRADLEGALGLVAAPRVGKWEDWADAAWFLGHERHCEAVLADFLRGPAPAP
jgi:hypothetical protein